MLFRGEKVFEDVIYAKADGSRVILKDVLGDSRVLENCRITEIDVGSERLVLSSIEAS